MFESIGQPPSPSQAPKPPATPLEIHTMPERFLGASTKSTGPNPAPKPGNKKLLLAIGIIVVVVLGAVAALVFTGVLNRNANNTNNVNLVTNTPVANTNLNRNSNSNANSNTNSSNANANTNVNGNANANTNASTNANANLNRNTNASNPVAVASADADKDGLTDAEETAFTTNPSSQDSDGDGFLDGGEVKLGFNPKGSGKLSASVLINSFTNGLYGATVLYPRSWTSVARSSTEQLFTSPTGDETMSVSVQDNPARLTAKQWYIQQAPSVDSSTLTEIQTWDKLSTGIASPDANAYYFANGSQVYLMSLSFGAKPSVDSRTTLEMLARSLVVDPSKVNLNTNGSTANTNSANTNVANTNSTTGNSNTNTSNVNSNTNTGL